jgi:hypothetical protein
MKRLIILLVLMGIVATSGCIQQVTCNKPYIKVGKECCLDINDNAICDRDEKISSTTTTEVTTTTLEQEKIGIACSPCFNYFTLIHYFNDTKTLQIKNGASNIRIESVVSRPQGASTTNCLSDSPCDAGAYINITNIPYIGTNIQVLITYTDMVSGFSHVDTAFIHHI